MIIEKSKDLKKINNHLIKYYDEYQKSKVSKKSRVSKKSVISKKSE
jgi:hypothetical protein